MPQTITKGYKALVAEARQSIQEVTAEQAIALAKRDDVLLVDLRDPRELEREGRIPGAFHCTRGMLE
ncbi:MAG: rhodanese-like domain-containing protein, partial [Hyphomicrobiaceae bacterium]|nr:rhodanese-like domain-containing protein [Hyphomicrobiaceae bacterium]